MAEKPLKNNPRRETSDTPVIDSSTLETASIPNPEGTGDVQKEAPVTTEALSLSTNQTQEGEDFSEQTPFANYNQVLGQRESSGDYTAENNLGYIGKYQFGRDALKDLGIVEFDAKGSQKAVLGNAENWTGKFGVNSKEEFLNSPVAQEKAVEEWNKLLDKRIKQRGLDKFIGTEVDGVFITAEGLRAATHLLGTGMVNRLFKSGDLSGATDANGVTAAKYINLFN